MTTTNLGMETPAHNSFVDTWEIPVNGNTSILDAVAGSVTTKSLSSSNVTLNASESRVAILRFTGTLLANVIITLGAAIKSWTVQNNTIGAFTITITGGSGNVVGVPPGSCQIFWDGANVDFVNLYRLGDYIDNSAATVPPWVAACTVPPLLLCNGATFSAVTYPQLNQHLGGNTLPDSRARARIPLDGGTGRVTTAGSGLDGSTRFAGGGAQSRIIAHFNLPTATLNTTISAGQGIHKHEAQNPGALFLNQESGGPIGLLSGAGNMASVQFTRDVTLPAMGGTTALGGSDAPITTLQPTYVGGITMIRAS